MECACNVLQAYIKMETHVLKYRGQVASRVQVGYVQTAQMVIKILMVDAIEKYNTVLSTIKRESVHSASLVIS